MREEQLRQIIREEMRSNIPIEKMSPAEVAGILGVTVETLAYWRCKGRGPAYTKAGGISYLVADVNEYILRKRVKTG